MGAHTKCALIFFANFVLTT